ncbi:ESX secretion-associated protein EspG [Nocardia sp. NPDC004278]
MTQQWKFTALEFLVLCDHYRAGAMPRPLAFESDEEVTVDQMDRRKRAVWEDLQRRLDGSFDGVIEVLRAPELFVQVKSWDEQDRGNKDKALRVHVARAGALGFVFEQVRGTLTYDAPMVVVTECDPRALSVAVVRLLPNVEGGRLPDIPLVTDPVEHIAPSWGSSFVRDDAEDRPVYRTQRFFQQRAELTGAITVVQGRSKFGPRGIEERILLWRDVADDGRYVMAVRDGRATAAVSTGRQELVNRIHKEINDLMERLETHWEWGRPEDRY